MKWSIPERIVESGREYMQDGRVVSIEPNELLNIWSGEVIGSQVYHVELDGSPKEQDFCTCPYWQEHGYCKHTVAVELEIKRKGFSRVLYQNPEYQNKTTPESEFQRHFNQGFKQLPKITSLATIMQSPLLTVEINIELLMEKDYLPQNSLLAIWLRVGRQQEKGKFYLVRDVQEFFECYQQKKHYQQSNRQHFLLAKEVFSTEQQKILTLLSQIQSSYNMLKGATSNYDKRYLLIPTGDAKDVFDLLIDIKQLHFSYQKKDLSQLIFSMERLPIVFQLDKQANNYIFEKVTDETLIYLEQYQWVLSEKYIYLLEPQQERVYQLITDLLKRTEIPQVIYTKTTLPSLFTDVLPELDNLLKIEMTEEISQEIYRAPLQIHFHLDYQKNKILLNLSFAYGEVIIPSTQPLDKSPIKQILIRDELKETTVQNQLIELLYQFSQGQYQKDIQHGEDLYHFFKSEIPYLQALGVVHVTEKLEGMFLNATDHQAKIEVTNQDSWLDVRFDISGIEKKEIENVIESLIAQKQFYQLKTGQILDFESAEFQKTSDALRKIRQRIMIDDEGTIQMPKWQSIELESAFADLNDVNYSTNFQQMVTDLTNPATFPVTIPTNLNANLREYQVIGFKWLSMLSHYQFGGILADDMGLGKTLQTLTYLLSEKNQQLSSNQFNIAELDSQENQQLLEQNGPIINQTELDILSGVNSAVDLNQQSYIDIINVNEKSNNKSLGAVIVAPASLIYNWKQECKKFTPDLSVAVVNGNRKERQELLAQASEIDILITSYQSMRSDIDLYLKLQLNYLILDEAQMVKNASTKTFKALMKLKVPKRFALSGTPIENSLNELWALFQLLMPGFFPSLKVFRQMEPKEIARMIQPFVLRREKQTVLKDLPEKIETNLYSPLTDEQKKIYLAYLSQMQNTLNSMDHQAFQKNRMDILAGITRLRQTCCDPRIFIDGYTGGSGKVEQVKEMLISAKENNQRVLLFSQFTSMLERLETELDELGLDTFYLHGSTKPKRRMEMVDAFNEGEKDVFLISLKAGGTGLNLTGADTVILFDIWWNPAVEQQAASRAHRLGQKKTVNVWHLIAEGTIEERILLLQEEKRELFQKVISGSQTADLNKLTEDDIRMILSIGTTEEGI